MLKREHIKQAIEAIARRDREIGYVLDEMLGMGRIALPAQAPADTRGEDFYFTVDGQPAIVRKGAFFNAGTAPLEERLLIRYGELIARNELAEGGQPVAFRDAADRIHRAGLGFMIDHELTQAAAQLKPGLQGAVALAAGYLEIKKNKRSVGVDGALFRGTVDGDKPAYFLPFPFCREALIQVADLNVDFFHVRFLLTCLARGTARNVYACVVDNRFEGLAYLTFKEQLFYRALEIHYIATARGRPEPGASGLKGVGAFLVAGVWLLWKIHYFKAKELLLDSEIGARGFYAAMGFQPRGMSGFALKNPEGRLVKVIVEMAAAFPELPDRAVSAVVRIIKRQVDTLRKRPGGDRAAAERERALHLVKRCLEDDVHPAFNRAVIAGLERYRRKIPEAGHLLQPVGKE